MLKPKTAAERLGLSVSKVYELLQTGDLAHYRVDGSILIDEAHMKDFLAAHEQRGRKTAPDQGKPVPRPRLRFLDLD